MKKKRGRSVRRNKNAGGEPDELVTAPHSFVIHKGLPGGHILELTKDFRKVMEPFTATSLKERKKNTIKDFVQIAGPLHVTHMCIFTRTDLGVYLKTSRLPRGPTLTFKVHNFALSRDVLSSLKKQLVIEDAFKHSPLMVMNGFSGEGMQMKLMTSMFQNMFPTINLTKVDLNTVRRCVLMNYNPSTKKIDFRHYAIKVAPVGISKGVKKVVQGKVPNLAKCEDISEFLTKAGMLSESEAEDDPKSHVTLPQKIISRGNVEAGKSAIRLSEVGPRLTLQLIKIEDGLMEGEVLYHDLIEKSEEEKEEIRKAREAKKKLKEKRKKIQETNQKLKENQKSELKEKSMKGILKKKSETDQLLLQSSRESNIEAPPEEDDDAQYYRDEVGEDPDKDLFSSRPTGMKRPPKTFHSFKSKRPRLDNGDDSSGKFRNRGDDKAANFKNREDRAGKFKNRDDKGGKFKSRDDKGGKFSGGKFKSREDKGGKFKSREDKGGKFKGKNKFDKSFKKGKHADKTNSRNRDFRPIGGGNAVKKGVRKFGGKRR